jgi:DNA-binding NarL/FixJ family response regulator
MLREMLHRVLEKDPAMRLVLETDSIRQIPRILDRIQADWLIATLTDDDRLPASVQSALERNPQVAVIGLSAEGDYAEVHEPQRPNGDRLRRRYSLDNISLYDLLKILGDE